MSQKEFNKNLKNITEKIVKGFKPEKIVLFGSYAYGNPSKDSDLDLFIITNTKNTRNTAREIDSSIFPRSLPIDILVYTEEQVKKRKKIGDFFINDILNKGKILYDRV
ncbi:MAG: nucleotidyltransferase domain-containing protein [bacterium]